MFLTTLAILAIWVGVAFLVGSLVGLILRRVREASDIEVPWGKTRL